MLKLLLNLLNRPVNTFLCQIKAATIQNYQRTQKKLPKIAKPSSKKPVMKQLPSCILILVSNYSIDVSSKS